MGLPKKILSVLSTRWRDPSVCEACGGEFTCGATLTGCWCASVRVSAETRAWMKARYTGCLCRDCLEGFERAGHISPDSTSASSGGN